MPELPWYPLQESIQSLREIGIVQQIYYIRPAYTFLEIPKDMPFNMAVRNKFVTGATIILEEICCHSSFWSETTVETSVIQLTSPNSVKKIG